jgi:hypothetical protein
MRRWGRGWWRAGMRKGSNFFLKFIPKYFSCLSSSPLSSRADSPRNATNAKNRQNLAKHYARAVRTRVSVFQAHLRNSTIRIDLRSISSRRNFSIPIMSRDFSGLMMLSWNTNIIRQIYLRQGKLTSTRFSKKQRGSGSTEKSM